VSAADGLARESGAERMPLVPGSFATAHGGGLELDASGSFVYHPPGEPGAFWGDDYFDYFFASAPQQHGRARFTVQPLGIDLTELAASSGAGFGVAGATVQDQVGSTVAGLGGARHRPFAPAGDVNGDGLEDFVIGVLGPSQQDGIPFGEGRGAYVLFGKRDASDVSLAGLSGSFPPAGFAIIDDLFDNLADSLGYSVAGAGDVNGDGLDDIVIGSHTYDVHCPFGGPDCNYVGEAYVIFGKKDSDPVRCEHLRASQGGGFAIVPPDDLSYLLVGLSVDKAGDVNGDGLGDVIVDVALLAPGGGSVFDSSDAISAPHVIFGKRGVGPVSLADVTAGRGGGFPILATATDLGLGNQVAGVGDVNGDGLDDVALSSEYYPNSDNPRGRTVVVLGKEDTSPVLLSDIEAGSGAGFFILGADDGDLSGTPSYAGDVNGDGFDDIVIGAPYATLGSPSADLQPDAGPSNALDAGAASDAAQAGCPSPPCSNAAEERGVVYLLYGKREVSNISLRELDDGAGVGVTLGGGHRFQHLGYSTSSGDINGDGLSDVIASSEPTPTTGEAYVLFGKRTSPGAESETDFTIPMYADTAEQACGIVVSGADTNGDGFDDLLLSSESYPSAPEGAGGAYVVFGWDYSRSQAGRDVALLGGPGDDELPLPQTPVVVVKGGNGNDTLKVGRSTRTLDLTLPGRYQSLEVIDMRGGGPQVILLNDAAVRRIPQNLPGYSFGLARRLTVLGDAEDTLQFDSTGYVELGDNAGRRVYGRPGAYYGLEVSLPLVPFGAP
jgi:FG-GAP repeat